MLLALLAAAYEGEGPAETGLQVVDEALALVDADVDLSVGVLTVRCSKFGKSRLVPLHPSAVTALRAYRIKRTK